MTAHRRRLEKALEVQGRDFGGAFQAARALVEYVWENPGDYDDRTVSLLMDRIDDPRHERRRLAYLLYRELAGAACGLLAGTGEEERAAEILASLSEMLGRVPRNCHRALAEGLGSLETGIRGWKLPEGGPEELPRLSLEEVMEMGGLPAGGPFRWVGRSLVGDLDAGRVLVVKCTREGEPSAPLGVEAAWMAQLPRFADRIRRRFDVPVPLGIGGGYRFRPVGLPGAAPPSDPVAVAFVVTRDYFVYPNSPVAAERLDAEGIREVMGRSAWLLARLCAEGAVHTAPIPLFHNRVQGHRRSDGGLYRWPKGGRLDRWLASALYPNFGMSGIRDLEHLEPVSSGGELYCQIGSHLLSLILVAGSYFREGRRGEGECGGSGGAPDHRHLFDAPLFRDLVSGIFLDYYSGFTGEAFEGEMPFDIARLTDRLIEEMGVDRHMEEVLRARDQKEMAPGELEQYLVERGFSEEEGKNNVFCVGKSSAIR